MKSHITDNKKYVEEVAVIRPIPDEKEATKELLRCKGDRFVYPTTKESTETIHNLVIDTGAVHSIISADAVFDLGIFAKVTDAIVGMVGIGGEDYSFRKMVDSIQFGSLSLEQFPLDFGNLDFDGINGLIGLDILLQGKFLIDLDKMEIKRDM